MWSSPGTVLALAGIGIWSGRASSSVLPDFPTYCAKDMSVMKIPSLADSVETAFDGAIKAEDVELLQVHAIIRHGARGPWTTPKCWEGYDETWDCNVTEVVSPSLSRDDVGVSETGLFRKIYDASPDDNVLGGSCMEGQLLDEGYTQEVDNGKYLREAYVCEGSLCLFANSSAEQLQQNDALYLRSDDEQRTVMSGQIVTAAMLNVSGVVLDWHTSDDEFDYIDPNVKACPRLTELSAEAFASEEWKNMTESFAALNASITTVWGREVQWWDVLDCLMTTACTARELPEGLTEGAFYDAISFSTREQVHESSYNDAAFGKLAMAKLTREIRQRMGAAVNGTSPVKFVLISGHDTTFIPFLSAVAPNAWDELWPPYATLSTIELLRVSSGSSAAGDYFRFVYNGQILRLDGCDKDICAIDAFMEATQFAADLDGHEHCCCRNMTQADVDASGVATEDGNSSDIAQATPAPVLSTINATVDPVDITPSGMVHTPAPTTSSSPQGNRSGLIASGSTQSTNDSGAGSIAGIAVACFAVGAIVGVVPAVLYMRSFRYEALGGNRHSFEMT